MKKTNRLFTALAWLGVAVATPAFADKLICKGGGAMTLGYDSKYEEALMYFQKSPYVGSSQLLPGQCSFSHRLIYANEPVCIRQKAVEVAIWWFVRNGQQSYANSADAQWLRPMTDRTKTAVFEVFNPGGGNCFTVTDYSVR